MPRPGPAPAGRPTESRKQHGIGRVQSARALLHKRVNEFSRRAVEAQHAAVGAAVYVKVAVPAEFQRRGIPDRATPGRNEDVHEHPVLPVVAQDRIRPVTRHVQISIRPEFESRGLLQLRPLREYAHGRSRLPIESQHAVILMAVDVEITIRTKDQARAVLIDIIAGSERVDKMPVGAVISKYGVGSLTIDIQIAVRPEDQRRRFFQAAARREDIDERAVPGVKPKDGVCAVAADLQVAVGAYHHTARPHQPARPGRDEFAAQLARALIEAQHAIGPVTAHQHVRTRGLLDVRQGRYHRANEQIQRLHTLFQFNTIALAVPSPRSFGC